MTYRSCTGMYERERIAKMEEVYLQQVKKVEMPKEDMTNKAIMEILKRMNANMKISPNYTPGVNQQVFASPQQGMSLPLMNQ